MDLLQRRVEESSAITEGGAEHAVLQTELDSAQRRIAQQAEVIRSLEALVMDFTRGEGGSGSGAHPATNRPPFEGE